MSDHPADAVEKMSKQERLYKEQMGEAALLRQKELSKELYPCCANPRIQGHHPLCKVARKRL